MPKTSSEAPQPDHGLFADWHPLKTDWFDSLSPHMVACVQYAQRHLVERRHTDEELAQGIAHIESWHNDSADGPDKCAPAVIVDHALGTRIPAASLVHKMLTTHLPDRFSPSALAALALLKAASGLSELDLWARGHELSVAAQYLAITIKRLYAAILLLPAMEANPAQREAGLRCLSLLCSDEIPPPGALLAPALA